MPPPTSTTTTRRRPRTSANCSPEGGVTSLLGFAAGLRELRLDLLRDLGQLGEDVDRLVLVLPGRHALELCPRPLEPLEELLGPLERLFLRVHEATFSRSILARIPFTSRDASSEA